MKTFILLFASALIFTPLWASAQEPQELPNPLGSNQTVESLVNEILDWLIKVGAPVATVMVIVGAFQMMFAGGSPEKFKTGTQTILYTVIGYGILWISKGIVSIIELLLE